MPERPGPWNLLDRPSDPIVADTPAIDAQLAHFRSLAESMRVEGQRLSAISSGAALKGQYADELRSASGDVAKDMNQVVGRYEAVVQALTAYQPAIDAALVGSASALDDAIDAAGAAGSADAMPTATATDSSTPLTPQQVEGNADKASATAAASGRLDAAKAKLASVISTLDDAGRQAASTVRGGFNDGLTDSGWDRFKYGFAKFLKILVKILTYIGMALAVIALVIPGLGEAILAAGIAMAAVVLVANVALKAMGEGSWADIGIAIAGLLTFGAAKVLGPAIQSGLRSAMGAVRGATGSGASAAEEAGGSIASTVGEDAEEAGSVASRSSSADGEAADGAEGAEGAEGAGEAAAGDAIHDAPTEAEQQAMTDYLGGGAHPMNTYLRDAGGAVDPEMEANASRISSLLSKVKPEEGWSTTYRGVTGRPAAGLSRTDTFVDPAFQSTTRTRGVAEEFALTGGKLGDAEVGGDSTLFTLYSEGIAKDVSPFTGLGEGEILFDRGTTWEVAAVKSLPEIVRVNGGQVRVWGVTLKMPGMDLD